MKYKFKAFIGPVLILIVFWLGSALFISGISVPQCGVDSCEKPRMPLINYLIGDTGFSPGDQGLKPILSKILHFLYLITNYLIAFLIILILVVKNLITGIKAGNSLRRFNRTNEIKYKEKHLKQVASIKSVFRIMLVSTIILYLITSPWSIQVKNPKFNQYGNVDGCEPLFNTQTGSFEISPNC